MLEALTEADRLAIVIFNHEAQRLGPLRRLTEKNCEKIGEAVS